MESIPATSMSRDSQMIVPHAACRSPFARDPGQRPRNTLGHAPREGGNRQLAGRGVSRDIDRTGLLQVGR